MRRRPAAIVTAIAAVAAAVPSAALAAPSRHDLGATKILVKVHDPKGDVVAKSGTLKDLSDNGPSPFKPGHGTVVTPTPADDAIDLTKVVYHLVRTGPKPALTITYTAKGPFSHAHKKRRTVTGEEVTDSLDIIGTDLAKGYDVQSSTERSKSYVGFFDKSGKRVACPGFRSTMKLGAHVATQTVPLSCLAAAGLRASALRPLSAHMAYDLDVDLSGLTGTGGGTHAAVTVALDTAAKTRTLPLTPTR